MVTDWTAGERRRARAALLRWFDAHARDLPWRGTRDAWAILVSEIMLQQTTVSAVTPYYERFLSRWPGAVDLAGATRDELLSEWAGLGYYRRAHMLMDCALQVVEGGGAMPEDAGALRELPGVGDYTAAAVASIAYDEPVAAVDGNVERVHSRLSAIPGDPRKVTGRKAIRGAAQALLDTRRPGDFNQAVMELGATVCRPRDPDCPRCPLASRCEARKRGEVARFPELPARPKPVRVERAALLLLSRRRLLTCLREQPPNAGFLELPSVELPSNRLTGGGDPIDAAADLVRGLRREHGLRLRVRDALPPLRHSITRFRIRVHPFLGSLSSPLGRPRGPLQWASPDDARPLTTATRRILSRSRPDFFDASPP